MSQHDFLWDFPVTSFENFPSVSEGCALGKQLKASYKRDHDKERCQTPEEFSHADLSGKNCLRSHGNSIFYILMRYNATSFCFIHFAKTRNGALPFFKKVIQIVKCDNENSLRKIWCDLEKEFCKLLMRCSMTKAFSEVPAPLKLLSRMDTLNVTSALCVAARSMLIAMNIPITFCVEGDSTAVHLPNRTINSQTDSKTLTSSGMEQSYLLITIEFLVLLLMSLDTKKTLSKVSSSWQACFFHWLQYNKQRLAVLGCCWKQNHWELGCDFWWAE